MKRYAAMFAGLVCAMLLVGCVSTANGPVIMTGSTATGTVAGAVIKASAGQKFQAGVVALCGYQVEIAVANNMIGALSSGATGGASSLGAAAVSSAEKALCDFMTAQAAVQSASTPLGLMGTSKQFRPSRPVLHFNGHAITIRGKWVL
jgi:hypothetical protein